MKKGTVALILGIIGPLFWFLANLGPYVGIGIADLPLFVVIGWLFSLAAFILALVARAGGEKAWGGLILGFIGAVIPFLIIGACLLLVRSIVVNIGC